MHPDPCTSTSVPLEMDSEDKNLILPDNKSTKVDGTEQIAEPSSDLSIVNIESFLPDCVNNVACPLETVLHNADTCRIFFEKKGIEAVLQLFTLPLMPHSVSVGQSVSVAFKNFSPQHYVSLAQAVCSFLREHLKFTNELLDMVGGTQLALVESARQTKVLKFLSSLEGVLSLCIFVEGNNYYTDQESEISQVPSSTAVERESDDDANIQLVRCTNPVFARNGSHSLWSGEREFLSVEVQGSGCIFEEDEVRSGFGVNVSAFVSKDGEEDGGNDIVQGREEVNSPHWLLNVTCGLVC